MKFIDAEGTPAQVRKKRDDHVLILDSTADRASELQGSFPELDWNTDEESGHPTIGYHDFLLLCGGLIVTKHHLGELLISKIPSDALADRVWKRCVTGTDLSKCQLGTLKERFKKSALSDETTLDELIAGEDEWIDLEAPGKGHGAGDAFTGPTRWLSEAVIGDFWATSVSELATKDSAAAADFFAAAGVPFLRAARGKGSLFVKVAGLLGRVLSSSDDEEICDAETLAYEVAQGVSSQRWTTRFCIYAAPGMARLHDLHSRFTVYAALAAESKEAALPLQERLPAALALGTDLELCACIVKGANGAAETAKMIRSVAGALEIKIGAEGVSDAVLEKLEAALAKKEAIARCASEKPLAERVEALSGRGAQGSTTASGSETTAPGEQHMAVHRQALDATMGTQSALDQVWRLSWLEQNDFDAVCLLEVAMSGELPPEARKQITAKFAAEASADRLARATSEASAIEKRLLADYTPLVPIQQLVCGTVKSIANFPELQSLADTAATRFPELLGRVVARTLSPNRDEVPKPLRGLRLESLAEKLMIKKSKWDVNLIDEAYSIAAAKLNGMPERLVVADGSYKDTWQLGLLEHIGTAIWRLFGARDDDERGWARIIAVVKYTDLITGQGVALRAARLRSGIEMLVKDSIAEFGMRVNAVRGAQRPDALPVTDFLAVDSPPLTRFHDLISATNEAMKRARTDSLNGDDSKLGRWKLPCLEERRAVATGATTPPAAPETGTKVAKVSLKGGGFATVALKQGWSKEFNALAAQHGAKQGSCIDYVLGGKEACTRGCSAEKHAPSFRENKKMLPQLKKLLAPNAVWPADAMLGK